MTAAEELPNRGPLPRAEAAVYLGVPVSTLALWHTQKKGPHSFKMGRRRFYLQSDLDDWITEQRNTAAPDKR